MQRHGLCGLETSQGRCMQDGKYCGWRVAGCALSSIWESFKFLIIAMVVALIVVFYFSYFGMPKSEEPAKKPALSWRSAPQRHIDVTVTGYSPRREETDDTPFTTAFNKRVKTGIIAISRDLEDAHGWAEGDTIVLEGIGLFEVGDRMNQRWRKRIDIFFFDTAEARRFGKVQVKAAKL